MSPGFLILHGYEGNSPGHWQTWLAQRLGERGHRVAYPGLPEPCTPRPGPWLQALAAELERLPAPPTVVCHSLACSLWLSHTLHRPDLRADRVVLVAPPSAASGVAGIQSFFPTPLNRAAVAAAAQETRIVASDADPYNPEGALALYGAPLGLVTEIVLGGGHLNTDAGFGRWPEMLAWCEGQRETPAPASSGANQGVET